MTVQQAVRRRNRATITCIERAERTQRAKGTLAAAKYMKEQGYSLEAALITLCR